MDISAIATAITTMGFPAFLCFFMVSKFEKTLSANTEATNEVAITIRELNARLSKIESDVAGVIEK